MKKNLILVLILFVACTPQVNSPSEITPAVPTQTEIVVPTLTATPTLTSEQTIEDLATRILAGEPVDLTTLTPEQRAALDAELAKQGAERVQELAQQYFDGEIDNVDFLPFDQQKEFSIAYNELKNAQRNTIIYTDRNGDQFCVSPTLDLIPLSEVTDLEQQTINKLPRVVDAEGFTHVYYNNEWVKIEGSNKIQFNNFDTFPWPAGEPVDPQWVPEEYRHLLGLTVPECVYKSEDVNMVPMFFLGKEHGETDIAGRRLKGTVLGYVIIENDPYSVLPAMITGNPPLYVDNLRAGSSGDITEHSAFYQAIISGKLYYLMYFEDQEENIAMTYPASNGQEATIKYKGLAHSGQTHDIITGETSSNDMALINTTLIVEAGK